MSVPSSVDDVAPNSHAIATAAVFPQGIARATSIDGDHTLLDPVVTQSPPSSALSAVTPIAMPLFQSKDKENIPSSSTTSSSTMEPIANTNNSNTNTNGTSASNNDSQMRKSVQPPNTVLSPRLTAPTVFITSSTATSEPVAFPIITVGPIIGLVTDNTARILIEANTTMTVKIRLLLVARNVRLNRYQDAQLAKNPLHTINVNVSDSGILRNEDGNITDDEEDRRQYPQYNRRKSSHDVAIDMAVDDPQAKAILTGVSSGSPVPAEEPSATSTSASSSSSVSSNNTFHSSHPVATAVGTNFGSNQQPLDRPQSSTSTPNIAAPATFPSPNESPQKVLSPNSAHEVIHSSQPEQSYISQISRRSHSLTSSSNPSGLLDRKATPENYIPPWDDLAANTTEQVIEKDVQCTAHRIATVTFTDLIPDARYELKFMNIRTRVPSSFTTLLSNWPVSSQTPFNMAVLSCNLVSVTEDLALPDSDLWLDLRRRVQNHEIDYLLHIGDQIYADEKRTPEQEKEKMEKKYQMVFRTSVDMLHGIPVDQWPLCSVHIKELYRQLYRETWSHPPTAYVLANIPSSMIYDDHDFRDDWGNEACDSDPNSREYYVGRCAHEIMCEYQRQLWDNVDFTHLNDIKKDFHFHVFGEHGIIFLDVRGPRSLHKLANEQYPYLGSLQWEEVKAALSDDGIMQHVKSLLMICPAPVVFLPTTINDLLGNSVLDDALGHWSSKPFKQEQIMMLNLCQLWQSAQPERVLTFIGGDVHVGGHSEITRDNHVIFQQFITSAISNYRLSKVEFLMGRMSQDIITTLEEGWGFKHRGFTRQRNYGIIQITRDNEGPLIIRKHITPKGEKPEADNRKGIAHLK